VIRVFRAAVGTLVMCGCRSDRAAPRAAPDMPHMRPAEQGASSALYFTLRNPSNDTLVLYGVEIDVATSAMFHRSVEHNGMAGMARLDSLIVAPRESLVLAERGVHVMANNLVAALHVGDTVSVRLLMRPARVDTIRAAVRE
jgi:copper(I)-binding protein